MIFEEENLSAIPLALEKKSSLFLPSFESWTMTSRFSPCDNEYVLFESLKQFNEHVLQVLIKTF